MCVYISELLGNNPQIRTSDIDPLIPVSERPPTETAVNRIHVATTTK